MADGDFSDEPAPGRIDEWRKIETPRVRLELARAAMTAVFTPRPATDQLNEAIGYVRSNLDRSIPVHDRIRILWAGVFAARDLGADDVIEDKFMRLARETGLAHDLGRHADADLRHVTHWAMLGRNPFE